MTPASWQGSTCQEIIHPLEEDRDIYTRSFDCKNNRLLPPRHIPFLPVSILEGSYCLHPSFGPYYMVYLFCSRPCRPTARLQLRTPQVPTGYRRMDPHGERLLFQLKYTGKVRLYPYHGITCGYGKRELQQNTKFSTKRIASWPKMQYYIHWKHDVSMAVMA